jgi:hypothetical protein
MALPARVEAGGRQGISANPVPDLPSHADEAADIWRSVWALPFLTILAPSERYWQEHKPGKRQHKKLTDWGRQILIQAAL